MDLKTGLSSNQLVVHKPPKKSPLQLHVENLTAVYQQQVAETLTPNPETPHQVAAASVFRRVLFNRD